MEAGEIDMAGVDGFSRVSAEDISQLKNNEKFVVEKASDPRPDNLLLLSFSQEDIIFGAHEKVKQAVIEVDRKEMFTALGVSKVLIAPEAEEFKAAMTEIKPHIVFGNSYDFQLAPDVPIQIHAAIPAYDYINLAPAGALSLPLKPWNL